MILPNYKKDNLINLMSSILKYNGTSNGYNELKELTGDNLKKYDNVVLFILDGIGYNRLENNGKGSFLKSKLKQKLTTVYPSTTACVYTTFVTGKTASEHSIMGRNMYSKEIGTIMQIFPWKSKFTKTNLGDEIDIKNIISSDSFFKNSNKEAHSILFNGYKDAKYNAFYHRDTILSGYNDLNELFTQISEVIKNNSNKKYLSVYWDKFDAISHQYGVNSEELLSHFRELDFLFQRLEKELETTNSLVIVTSDHGQVDCINNIRLDLEYPEIYEMLLLPLSGAERYNYCHVKNGLQDDFYKIVKKKLKNICDIYSKKEMLKMDLFGYGNDEKFLYRIGDFLIIPKVGYRISDKDFDNEVGAHGGYSSDEMHTPLIIF